MYNFSFSSLGILQNLFLNLLLWYIALPASLVMKGAWFPLKNFFFKGACFSTILENSFVISSWFSFGSSELNLKSAFLTSSRKFFSLKYLKYLQLIFLGFNWQNCDLRIVLINLWKSCYVKITYETRFSYFRFLETTFFVC